MAAKWLVVMGRLVHHAEPLAPTMPRLRIAVVAALAAWALFFSLAPLRGLFWLRPGEFPLQTDSSLTVVNVDPGGGAERAGIRVGDRVEGPDSLEDRLYFQALRYPAPGQSFALRVRGKSGSRIAKIRTAMVGEFDALTLAYYFAGAIIDLIFVVVGSILVLLRPAKMTWAFFLYCVAIAPGLIFYYYWLPTWLDYGASVFADVLRSLGYGAFLVFCVRVPNDRAVGRWRYLERVAAPLVVASLLFCSAVIDLSVVGVLHTNRIAVSLQDRISDATYILGAAALIATFCRERGVERNRVGWIIAGFAVAFGAREGASFSDLYGRLLGPGISSWLDGILELLQAAIPLTVAYAVVRHHALNAGFIANRTIVYSLSLCVGFAAFLLLDVLATKRFASNEFEVGVDVAVALAIGLSFTFVHPRVVRLIDRIFLPERYRSAIALDKLRKSFGFMRFVRNHDDGPRQVVDAVAKELMLSSLAVFRKVPDGGFVRYAATGWPKGSAWHILAGDPLVQSFGGSTRIRPIDEANMVQLSVPPKTGRPTVGLSLSAGTSSESLILVGAHVNGRRPDRDEVRGIAALLREFG